MKPEEAAQVIDVIVKSLRDNPGQFNLNVEVTVAGAVGVGGPGGPGIVGISQGGGTGVSASASAPSEMTINIAQCRAEAQFGAELERLLSTLDDIKAEVLRPDASADRAQGLLKRLVTWVPETIVAVVAQLIATSIRGKLPFA